MSMVLAFITLGDANIARVVADPPLVWRVIAPDDPEPYEEARRASPSTSLLGRFFRKSALRGGEAAPEALTLAEGEGLSTDLDKSWHGIHYLLTGTAWEGAAPLNFLVSGGRAVGDLDVGYGPARVLTSAETRAAQEALATLGDDALRARFNAADMMAKEIYPEIWDRAPEQDDTLGYLLEYVGILKGFLARAVDRKHGLVVYLS